MKTLLFAAVYLCAFASTAWSQTSPQPWAEMYISYAKIVKTSGMDNLTFQVDFSGLKRDVLDFIDLDFQDPQTGVWSTNAQAWDPYALLAAGTSTKTSGTIGPWSPSITSHDIRVVGRRDQPGGVLRVAMITDGVVIPNLGFDAYGFLKQKSFETEPGMYKNFIRVHISVDSSSAIHQHLKWAQYNFLSAGYDIVGSTPAVNPGETLVWTFNQVLDSKYVNAENQMRSALYHYTDQSIDHITVSDLYSAGPRDYTDLTLVLSGTRDVSMSTVTNQAAQNQTEFEYTFDWRERFAVDVATNVQFGSGSYWLELEHETNTPGGNLLDIITLQSPSPPNAVYALIKDPLSPLDFDGSYKVISRLIGAGNPVDDIDFISPNYDNSLPNHTVWAQ